MKNLIIYATQYGCAAEVAQELASLLDGETDVVNIKRDTVPALSAYDKVILGGSVYAGNIQKEIKDYTAAHQEELLQKPLGIFLCGMGFTDTGIANSFEYSFNQEIREHARIMDMVGGKLQMDKLKFVDRYIIKIIVRRMIKYEKDQKLQNGQMPENTLDHKKIEKIARVMNKY